MGDNEVFRKAVAEYFSEYFSNNGADAQKIHIVQRFNAINSEYSGKLTLSKLYKIWVRLYNERKAAENNLRDAQEQANKLIGTGLNGIGAQLRLEKVYKCASTYEDRQFEELYICICYAIHMKIVRINKKIYNGKSSVTERQNVMALVDALELMKGSNWFFFEPTLKNMTDSMPKVELSTKDMEIMWKKVNKF